MTSPALRTERLVLDPGAGVGSRLVEAFLAWSRERGAERFHVSAYAANASAIRFYRRHGFVPLSVELAYDTVPGRLEPEI